MLTQLFKDSAQSYIHDSLDMLTRLFKDSAQSYIHDGPEHGFKLYHVYMSHDNHLLVYI